MTPLHPAVLEPNFDLEMEEKRLVAIGAYGGVSPAVILLTLTQFWIPNDDPEYKNLVF